VVLLQIPRCHVPHARALDEARGHALRESLHMGLTLQLAKFPNPECMSTENSTSVSNALGWEKNISSYISGEREYWDAAPEHVPSCGVRVEERGVEKEVAQALDLKFSLKHTSKISVFGC